MGENSNKKKSEGGCVNLERIIWGAISVVIGGAILFGCVSLFKGCYKQGVKDIKDIFSNSQLQVKDLNNNGLPEKFYEIEGKKYFLEIDGKNLEDVCYKK